MPILTPARLAGFLSSLTMLDLSGNDFERLPRVLPPSLRVLSMADNLKLRLEWRG